MILGIDAGNSRIKIAMVGSREIRRLSDVPTKRFVERPAQFDRLISDFADQIGDVTGAALSSVVPSLNAPLKKAIRAAFGVRLLTIDAGCRYPFRVAVKNPVKVGVDRLAAAAGLQARISNAIIVDIGTAITVDLVRDGAFMGGLIMPGPALGLSALGAYARKLPEIDYAAISRHFPGQFDDTRPSMILGTHLGAVGAVREAARFLAQKSRRSPLTIVTGGGAPALDGRWPSSWRHDPDLVLRGIRRIWILNHK